MFEDGGEILVAEAAGSGRPAQSLVNLFAADEGGELNGPGHLGSNSTDALAGSGAEPDLGAFPYAQKGTLSVRLRAQTGLGHRRPVGVAGVMLIDYLGSTGNRKAMAHDLAKPVLSASDDDQLLSLHPAPHLFPNMARRRRVAHRPEADGLVVVHDPGLAQRRRVRLGGQGVEVDALVREHLERWPVGLPVRPGIDLLAEGLTGLDQLPEAAIGRQQVGVSGDQVGLGNLDRGFRAALRLGVGGDAGLDPEPIVAAGGKPAAGAGPAGRQPGPWSPSSRCR